jgi:alpha-tubulin suppressor-like RCC1 family protein
MPPAEIGGSHQQTGYGVLALDNRSISLTSNEISANTAAAIVHDMAGWDGHPQRMDLAGEAGLALATNDLSANLGPHVVIQNRHSDCVISSDDPDGFEPPSETLLSTASANSRSRCGDGRISGAEQCDPEAPSTRALCAQDCTLRSADRVDSGDGFTCLLGDRRKVYCFGQNIRPILVPGQTDDTDRYQLVSPQRVDGMQQRGFSLAAGARHVCIVTVTGKVSCWGESSKGQTGSCGQGQGFRGASWVLSAPGEPLGTIAGVTAGLDHSCAWTGDGRAYCWGDNRFGQLGFSPEANEHSDCALEVATRHRFSRIAAGDQFTCGVAASKVHCWGLNAAWELGGGSDEDCNNNVRGFACSAQIGAAVEFIASARSTPISTVSVSAGAGACAVHAGTNLVCWGAANRAQIPATVESNIISNPSGRQAAVSVIRGAITGLALGSNHGCAATDHGLQCWGEPAQVGVRGDDEPRTTPASVSFEEGIIGAVDWVSAGVHHTCVKQAGRVVCWGAWFRPNGEPDRQTVATDIGPAP